MIDNSDNSGSPADDMSEYLQTFLDETEEQLDDLVETMLALETDSTSAEELNEAFRLIHSIKGSAGMMGFDNITLLTHHLETRFERFRSGRDKLDEPSMNLALRCIDFLRQCNGRLRDGEPLGSATELLEDLKRLEERSTAPPAETTEEPADTQRDAECPCRDRVTGVAARRTERRRDVHPDGGAVSRGPATGRFEGPVDRVSLVGLGRGRVNSSRHGRPCLNRADRPVRSPA